MAVLLLKIITINKDAIIEFNSRLSRLKPLMKKSEMIGSSMCVSISSIQQLKKWSHLLHFRADVIKPS